MAPEPELPLPVLTSYNVTISAATTRPGRPSPPSWTPAAYPAGTTISDVPIKDIQDRHLAALAALAAQAAQAVQAKEPRRSFVGSKCQTRAIPSNKHRKGTGHPTEFRFE
jgi:hypothetical protein